MAKWGDYLVTAVMYDSSCSRQLIKTATVHKDFDKKLGWSRKWDKGRGLRVVKVEGSEYIRIDDEEVAEDDLGPLPQSTRDWKRRIRKKRLPF